MEMMCILAMASVIENRSNRIMIPSFMLFDKEDVAHWVWQTDAFWVENFYLKKRNEKGQSVDREVIL